MAYLARAYHPNGSTSTAHTLFGPDELETSGLGRSLTGAFVTSSGSSTPTNANNPSPAAVRPPGTPATPAVTPSPSLPGTPELRKAKTGWSGVGVGRLTEKAAATTGRAGSFTIGSSAARRVPTGALGARSTAVAPRKEGSWAFELVSLLVATLAVGAIVGVLRAYHGKPLPSWPYHITLNAMIALLATVANASLAVPLSNGLSQLKWNRFRTRLAPVADMEAFDDASRGSLGAVALLVKMRGGVIGSFGALVVLLALTLNPFSQQIVTYRTRSTPSVDPSAATNPRALNYTAALPSTVAPEGFVPILPLKAAVYNGLFAENGKPWLSLPFACSTGNCTWPDFETLAVCNHCVDMSDYMTRLCPDGREASADMSECGWQLPGGASLKSGAEVFSMTPIFPSSVHTDMSYSTLMKLVFMGTEAQDGLAGALVPWARQCTLSACVQTLSSAVVNGELRESILGSVANSSLASPAASASPSSSPAADADGSSTLTSTSSSANTTTSASSQPADVQITSAASNATYSISAPALLALRGFFASVFAPGTASRNSAFINRTLTTPAALSPGVGGDRNVVVNLTVGISSGQTFFDTDVVQAFYWNYYEYPKQHPLSGGGANPGSGIDMLVSDLATALTVSFRAFAPGGGTAPVPGVADSLEGFVYVRWGFLAVPVALVVLAAVFLALAGWDSWRKEAPLWKGSVLAGLVHGLGRDAREALVEGAEVEAVARRERRKERRRRARWNRKGGNVGDEDEDDDDKVVVGLRELRKEAKAVKVKLDGAEEDGGGMLRM